MKNFDWTQFTRRISVKATIKDIYRAWTTVSGIEKWFLRSACFYDLEGKSIDRVRPVENGFSYDWEWYLYEPVESGKIVQANGQDFLQFTFAGQCFVDITLKNQDAMTIVELTHKNIPIDESSKENIRLGCDAGWSFFLLNLKSVYETGHDLRNKNPNLKGMLNN